MPGELASRTAKIRIGDRILAVNGQDITNVSHEEAVRILSQAKNPVNLRIRHEQLPKGWKVSLLFQ